MDINILILQMTKLFIIMFLGYIIFKLKVVDEPFTKKFSKLVLNVTQPAMILASVLNLTERQKLSDVLTAFIVSAVLFFIVLPAVGFLVAKLFRVKKNQTGLYSFMCSYSNVGFMGFPVINALVGPVGLFYAAIFNLTFNLAIYTLGYWLIEKDTGTKSKFSPKSLLNPGLIGAAISILIYFANIKSPEIITQTIDMVGSITSPGAMLIIGFTLAKMDIKNVFNDWRIYPWTIVKQIVIPLLLWIPLKMVISNELLLTVSFILLAMPIANTAVLISTDCGADTELAARSIFITTLFALASVPLCVLIVM